MSILVDKRNDGSMAFFLDGDLQFDSRDERIYHEALALPALALIESRSVKPLRALIIGGGDGLTARELLKSARIATIDLVDYDEKVLQLARTEFSTLNGNSLGDPRLNVTVEDARSLISRAIANHQKYDLIISDLTASHDADSAQLHTIEFYESLRNLLTDDGIVAVNSASPSGTPQAYWSIFNSILASSLQPRAYRIFLPSFAEQRYGPDWGFILASPRPIDLDEVNRLEKLVEPRFELKNTDQIRDMFHLPQSVVELQPHICAGSGASDVLVQYLFNPVIVSSDDSLLINTLTLDYSTMTVPRQSVSYLLPQELQETLSHWHDRADQQNAVMAEVFEIMPALQRHQTRELIRDFLAKPEVFLAPIDLNALVDAMLKRVSELPEKVVKELQFLKEKIVECCDDHERLLELGLRSMAIIAVVVILGNLIYPDAAYAKGHPEAHHAGTHHGGTDHVGINRGGINYGGSYTNGHWGPWFTNANGKRVRNWVR